MNLSTIIIGDKVLITGVFFEKHAEMVGKTGTVTKIYKTKDYAKVNLDDGQTWWATSCNLKSHEAS